ncbi:MAG: hypothetical protein LUD47_03985, partial [Clostridia bacterium]|nr:hypothetical protein [Clostridia bacterium]
YICKKGVHLWQTYFIDFSFPEGHVLLRLPYPWTAVRTYDGIDAFFISFQKKIKKHISVGKISRLFLRKMRCKVLWQKKFTTAKKSSKIERDFFKIKTKNNADGIWI